MNSLPNNPIKSSEQYGASQNPYWNKNTTFVSEKSVTCDTKIE